MEAGVPISKLEKQGMRGQTQGVTGTKVMKACDWLLVNLKAKLADKVQSTEK